MQVITDNPHSSEALVGPQNWVEAPSDLDTGLPESLPAAIFGDASLMLAGNPADSLWQHLLVTAEAARSQYDILIELSRDGVDLPDGLACLAAQGNRFHGFKGRPWASPSGNVYLCTHFAPGRPVPDFGPGFLALAAVSVVEAIDCIDAISGRAAIKWVNDILISDAKVGGVLAHTSTQGTVVTSAILGIGLNVLAMPEVAPTPFVPQVTSLRQQHDSRVEPDLLPNVVRHLLAALERNYRLLLEAGYRTLLDKYRDRSMVVGREVAVCVDAEDSRVEVIAEGRVTNLSDRLELTIAGCPAPVASGRLILK